MPATLLVRLRHERWTFHRPHGGLLQNTESKKADPLRGPTFYVLVAGAGFEPATFGL